MSQSYDALLFLAERDSGVMSSGYCTLSGESAPPGWIADCFILVRVCVSVCVCTLRRRANGNVLFNLTVFSLDRRSEIQVIDATVWYSPSCARFTAGTAAFKSARTRGNGRCDLTLLTASEVFFGDLVSAASQHTHVRARTHPHSLASNTLT